MPSTCMASRTHIKKMEKLPLLGITMGDPAGIGAEVIVKALAGPKLKRVCFRLVIGSRSVMEHTIKKLKLKLEVRTVEGHERLTPRATQLALVDPVEKPLGQYKLGVRAPANQAASLVCL